MRVLAGHLAEGARMFGRRLLALANSTRWDSMSQGSDRTLQCSRQTWIVRLRTLAPRLLAVGREAGDLSSTTRPDVQGEGGEGAKVGDLMTVTLVEPRSESASANASMEKFVIEGGVPLGGTVRAAGNKNGALPILAASLLTSDDVVIGNVPRIRDTQALLDLLADLGVRVAWTGANEVTLNAADVDGEHVTLDQDLAEAIRASFLLAGPLLARFGRAVMPPPGGDVIGRRRLDPHLDAFEALGATYEHGRVITLTATGGRLSAGTVFMDEPSVMATENALLAAALTPGITTIGNAACEPHVQDLARMLVKMGAQIDGIGSNVLVVHGEQELGGCSHEVGPDHIEIGSFMALAGVTGGELRIERVDHGDLRMICMAYEKLGLHSYADGDDLIVPGDQQLIAKRDVGEHKMRSRTALGLRSPPTSPRSPWRSPHRCPGPC